MSEDEQVARVIYFRFMSAMKEVLKLGEFKIGDKSSADYAYFKRIVMDQYYAPLLDLFGLLQSKGLLERCPCGTNARRGYKNCEWCNGAGFRNVQKDDQR
jgi:hypothetical protein